VDLHADPLADLELVDVGSEGCDGAHIFVAWREILVEGKAALNARRRARMNDFEIGGTDCHRIDPDQDFRA
jgi:hypothetical protein